MTFTYIERGKEEEYKNERYYVRAYGEKRGNFISDYESIKENCTKEKKYCLVEKKTEYYKLFWDFDFKKDLEKMNKGKEYLENHKKITKYIIKKIEKGIDKIIKDANKEYVYSKTTGGLGKHINYVNIIVNTELHLAIYRITMKEIEEEEKYDKEIIEKIFDESICKANGIRLFGCEHNGGYYYPSKKMSTYKIKGNIEEDFEHCLINTDETKYNNEINEEILNEILGNKKKKEKKKEERKETEEIEEGEIEKNKKKEIENLLKIIKGRNKKYKDWIKVGMALYTENKSKEMMEIWYEWSSIDYNSDKNEIITKWKSFKNVEDPITIKTIKSMAREENVKEYIEHYNEYDKEGIVELIKDFDQQTVAIYFKKKKKDDYVYKDGEWYAIMENNLWKRMNRKDNSKLINDITETVKGDLIELKNNLRPEDEILKLIPPTSKKLGTSKFILGVIDFLREKYRNDEIEFDKKANLFGFNNVVYDLEKNEFRKYKREDNVEMTTGYDWEEPLKEDVELIKDILKKVHIKDEIREFYLDILCSGLWGTPMQYFIIFNGGGSNGKSVLDDLMLSAVGSYGHIINSIIFNIFILKIIMLIYNNGKKKYIY